MACHEVVPLGKEQGCGMPGGSECCPSDTDWNGPSREVIANDGLHRSPILFSRSGSQLPLTPRRQGYEGQGPDIHSEAGGFGLRFLV